MFLHEVSPQLDLREVLAMCNQKKIGEIERAMMVLQDITYSFNPII